MGGTALPLDDVTLVGGVDVIEVEVGTVVWLMGGVDAGLGLALGDCVDGVFSLLAAAEGLALTLVLPLPPGCRSMTPAAAAAWDWWPPMSTSQMSHASLTLASKA